MSLPDRRQCECIAHVYLLARLGLRHTGVDGEAVEVIEAGAVGPGRQGCFAVFTEYLGKLRGGVRGKAVTGRHDAPLARIDPVKAHAADLEWHGFARRREQVIFPERGKPPISRFARKRRRASSTVTPGYHEATASSVAVLIKVGPGAFVSSGKPPSVFRPRVIGCSNLALSHASNAARPAGT